MELKTIATLANTPPPIRKWKFSTARTAHAEINRLESLLGLPQSQFGHFGFNLTRAHQKIAELESKLKAKAVVQTALPPVAIPVAPKIEPEKFGLERASAAARVENDKPAEVPIGLTGRARAAAAVRIKNG
jgi:hypothetical protein